jgi:hypothetical protein
MAYSVRFTLDHREKLVKEIVALTPKTRAPRGGIRLLAALRRGTIERVEDASPEAPGRSDRRDVDAWNVPIVERQLAPPSENVYAPPGQPKVWRSPVGMDSDEYARERAFWASYGRLWP